ncbi:hypothetical protein QFC22_003692 [Naganishia vaughanmartiniae]|uniref:Uncharacterized protein n=1 Tax=Naganishia vaughanmartiniae TaxID=1424756 RepID=A0ACC2X5A9_9TREE|nr:hypothetical protein QFC22_003692 [Naganishia vaughanmartiniae]
MEDDSEEAVRRTSEVLKLQSYGQLVANALDTHIGNYESKIRTSNQLDDEDDALTGWKQGLNCLKRLKRKWVALCHPIPRLMSVKDELVVEHIELALKEFLQPTEVKAIFNGGGNVTAEFALTPEAMCDTHAIDAVSGENGSASQSLRNDMKSFYLCSQKALREVRTWMERSESMQRLLGALEDGMADFEAENSLMGRDLSLADTTMTFTSEDCGLYAASFQQQLEEYKKEASRRSNAVPEDETPVHQVVVERGLHFWTKYFSTQDELLRNARERATITTSLSHSEDAITENQSERSVEQCASALKTVKKAIKAKLALLSENVASEDSRFCPDQFFSVIDAYGNEIAPAIFESVDGPTKSEMGDDTTSVASTSGFFSRSSTPKYLKEYARHIVATPSRNLFTAKKTRSPFLFLFSFALLSFARMS